MVSRVNGVILACIGSAVGMGNIWRFPIMVQKYGGMTFLLPYFIFVILIGSTGVIEEFALGRRAAAGPVGAFGMCTKERTGSDKSGKAIGAIPIIGALMLAIGYTVVLGWIFKYTFMSLSGSLFSLGTDMGAIGGTFGMTAPEAETLPEALKAMASAGFFGIGNGVWQIVALVVSLAIMVMGVAGGIEKANKVMMPVLFGLFLVLAIYIGTLPGASEGYKYILTLNPAGLLKPDLWVFAFGQAFFSLSVAGNGSVIYGSYLSKSEDIPSSARNVAVFDTAFHQTMPPKAYMYGLPYEYYEKYKVRRYGFHGTSHSFVSKRAAELLGKAYDETKTIVCHLGNGSSVTAVLNGKSVDTSMGLTPLEGLVMGTRCGDIDPAIMEFLAHKLDLDVDGVMKILNKDSGVYGLSGGLSSDFRDLTDASLAGDKKAQIAMEVFSYRVAKYIGAYVAVMNGVDDIVFTAGIGENDDIVREQVCSYLGYLGIEFNTELNKGLRGKETELSMPGSKVKVFVIPTNEELAIARETLELVRK